jgi:hypothetical protein
MLSINWTTGTELSTLIQKPSSRKRVVNLDFVALFKLMALVSRFSRRDSTGKQDTQQGSQWSMKLPPRREPNTPKGFADIVDDAEIWAVDPGISTIFTKVGSTEHERARTTSLEEYFHLCGYNLATKRRKEHQECHLDEFKYISELPTLKTANLTSFLLAASTRLQNYQRIHNYCCQDKWYVALLNGVHFNNSVYGIGLKSKSSRFIPTSKKELKKSLKDSLTTAKSMTNQV